MGNNNMMSNPFRFDLNHQSQQTQGRLDETSIFGKYASDQKQSESDTNAAWDPFADFTSSMQPTTTDKKDKTQRQKSKDSSLSSVVRSVKNEMSLKEKSFVTYNNDGIKIVFYFMESEQRNMCRILAVFTNNNIFEVDQFSFKVSVPNYIKLQMKPANDTKLLPLSQNSIEQKLQVINTM